MAAKTAVTFNLEIAAVICSELAAGKTLRQVCRGKHMPSEAAVRQWVEEDRGPGFASQYARARNLGLDAIADQIIELSDKCREGQKIERKEISRRCSLCGKDARWLRGWVHSEDSSALCETAEAEKVTEDKVVTGDMIERSKLQVDARKWYLSKLAPKRYGERLELAGDKDAPLTVTVRRLDKD